MNKLDFKYSDAELKELSQVIIDKSLLKGANEVQITITENIDSQVDVLNKRIENIQSSYTSNLILIIYKELCKGTIAISNTSLNDVDVFIDKALDIAKYTQKDDANGIPDKSNLCNSFNENLHLYNSIDFTNNQLIEDALQLESLTLKQSNKITQSEGASINYSRNNFIIANSNSLSLGYKTSSFSKSISAIGLNSDNKMQTDYWYSAARDFSKLSSNEEIAKICANRLLRRLNVGKIKSQQYTVIFEENIAKSIISSLLLGLNGNSLYRNLSFLNNTLDKMVMPNWLSIIEDPFVPFGLSSCYFDAEGVNVNKRKIVESGIVKSYILNNYTAKKLNMQTTGNCGGNHNIFVTSNINGGISDLIQIIDRGLIIIETIGHGVNTVTGDYSVGASALYFEDKEIKFFVDNLTISGNLKDMFNNISHIATDSRNSSINCGSMVINNINVATN